MIFEDRRIQRQPDERGGKAARLQPGAGRDAATGERAREGQSFQGPTEGDPFPMKLQGKNQTNEKEKCPTLPGEPRIAARRFGAIKFEQRHHSRCRGRKRKPREASPSSR